MKVLKYILVTLLVIIVLFFAAGMIIPTISYSYEISVDKPLKEAWAVSQDESKYNQWLEGYQSMELLDGEYMKPGSKYKVMVQPEGQQALELTQTIIEINEYSHVLMHYESVYNSMEYKISQTEDGDMTTIRTESKVKANGALYRSIFALSESLAGIFSAQEKKNIDALKKVIEENTKDYYPLPVASE